MSGEHQIQGRLKKILQELDRLSKLNKPSGIPHRVELCREALGMVLRETQPELWGKLKNDLANSLVESPVGVRAENIEEAIHYYQEALEVRTREADAEKWATTQFNLAGAYHNRICGGRMENLEQALWHCGQALEVNNREDFPHEWAQSQNTLGAIYRVRIRGSRVKNIEQAITHLEQALEVHNRRNFPQDWAMVENNLAAAYADRLIGLRVENIERAIKHAEQALEFRTRATDPERWAMTQHNLGHAYRYRIRGDPAENIEQAIRYFQQALEVRTRLGFPREWAETQNNLGDSCLARLHGEPAKNAEEAINHFQQALEVYTYDVFPEYWAQVHSNLGNAYLASPGDRAENIENAIYHYEQALRVRARETYPEDWAQTQNNLAGAYTQRIRGERADNIEQAIQHLQRALQVYTRESFPQDWAGTQNNLAIAYSDRKQGEKAKNIEQAIDHYLAALEVYTSPAFPEHCLKTARALGNLAFEEKRWKLAMEMYDKAFGAQDLLMQASFSREGKQVELGEVQNLPARAAYAHLQGSEIEQADVEKAVQVLERGRAQLLRESLERRRKDLEQLPDLGFERQYQDYIRAVDQLDELQKSAEIVEGKRSGDRITRMEQALDRVQATAAVIREEAGQKYPQYRYFQQALPFVEIKKQAWSGPLIYLSATSAGGLALIVTGQGVRALELPELKQASLLSHIWSPSDNEVDEINAHLQKGMITLKDIQAVQDGYFSIYALWSLANTSRELNETWQKTLDRTTRWLWNVVMGTLIDALKEDGYESITLIPAGHLALLPLHAAWTDDPSKLRQRRYALDELNISYAPSAHVLWQASLAAERPAESLMIVDNPDGSLLAARDEVRGVRQAFKKVKHLPGRKATVKAVKEKMRDAGVLHFATHGNAGWQQEEQARLKLAGGYLTLPAIFDLHLRRARLAVLSACETGVPSLKLIDEMIGLPAGMMQAGVPGVVGSLWIVNDMSTALLMQRFYMFWREEGKSPQEALRQAQLWLRDKVFPSPYYWAAFTYTGV